MGRDDREEYGIHEICRMVREELRRIRKDTETAGDAMMELSGLELELKVVTTTSSKGGLKFLVVRGEGGYKKENISTIKLSFQPVSTAGLEGKGRMMRAMPVLLSPFSTGDLRRIKARKGKGA